MKPEDIGARPFLLSASYAGM